MGSIFLVTDVSYSAVVIVYGFLVYRFCRAFFDADSVRGAVIRDPGMLIVLVEGQVINAGIFSCQSSPRTKFRGDDQATVRQLTRSG